MQTVQPQVAGILLAAGSASRMGQPKLLLPYQGQPLIQRAARIALTAGLTPTIVVTGAYAEDIHAACAGVPVEWVHNPNWRDGQSTSVIAGMQSLPASIEAVIFLLGDQPLISPELIQGLIQTYAVTRPQILAPFVGGRRSNPVLFDRSVFHLLLQLQGDAGARSLFHLIPPSAMPWPDERLAWDIDTPADYERLLHPED